MKNKNEIALGAFIGISFGSLIGILTNNIGIWISLGTAIGFVVGSYISAQKNDKVKDQEPK